MNHKVVIDEPLNRIAAQYLQSQLEWFDNVMGSRKNPNVKPILIMSRVHEDDIMETVSNDDFDLA